MGRRFLISIVLILSATLVFAGGQKEEGAAESTSVQQQTSSSGYSEAPEFAQQVAAGQLPPVEERLPEDPMVVEVDEIGVYGGDLQYPSTYTYGMNVWIRESLTLFKKGTQDPIPALAKGWDMSSDAREFTFYLREGHRWSDGEPFTTDDIMFWWDDIMENEQLTPVMPSWMQSGGPTTVTKIDDQTFKFTFTQPYPMFPKVIAFRGAYIFEQIPKHYLSQFHAAYIGEEKATAMAKDAGFDSWTNLFLQKYNVTENLDCPTLDAWMLVQKWPESTRQIWVRNPYYYKVDPAGNQLPYIDRVVAEKIENTQIAVLKVVDGQTDFQYKFMNFGEYPMLKEGEQAGGYRVLQWNNAEGWVSLHMNQTYKDPEVRSFLQNRDFRYALSYAIDRNEINDLLMFGRGEISQMHPLTFDDYYQAGMGDTAIEYDPEKANALLDEVGLDKRDSNGWRLLPSGKRLELTIETFNFESGAKSIDFYTLVSEHWAKVGVKTDAKVIDASLLRERSQAGETMINGYTMGGVPGYGWDMAPSDYVPILPTVWYAPGWGLWYSTGGKDGLEPPQSVKDLFKTYESFLSEPDADTRLQLGRDLVLNGQDQEIWSIAILRTPFQPVIVNSRLRNVLEDGVMSWFAHHEGQTWHETLFYVDGKRK